MTILKKRNYLFEKDDRIRLRQDSEYFVGQGGHGTGTIIDNNTGGISYNVQFDDGYKNSYTKKDLTVRGVE